MRMILPSVSKTIGFRLSPQTPKYAVAFALVTSVGSAPALTKLIDAVETAAHVAKRAATNGTASLLLSIPNVPWSGLYGIGRVVQTSGWPAPLTIKAPAADARSHRTSCSNTESASIRYGRPRIDSPILRRQAMDEVQELIQFGFDWLGGRGSTPPL